MKLRKVLLLGMCAIAIATSVLYTIGDTNAVYASDTLVVTPKANTNFYVNQIITSKQFDITVGGSAVDESRITITPNVFSTAGQQQITVAYNDSVKGYYQQTLTIDVQNVTETALELATDNLVLVKNQSVTADTLPAVYLCYSDGSKKVITDFTYDMDWNASMLSIKYHDLSNTFPVTVIDSTVQYISVASNKSVVPVDYIFQKGDLTVTAYFTNGMHMVVNEYEIVPYSLAEGVQTIITVKYRNVTGTFIVTATAPVETMAPTTNFDYPTPVGATPVPSSSIQNAQVGISIEKTKVIMGIGETVNPEIKITGASSYKLQSKNTKVAKVTSKGEIRGISKGSTKITVKVGDKKAQIAVRVYPAPKRIGVTSSLGKRISYQMEKGSKKQIATYFPKGTYSNKITFKSSNKKVATVSKKGLIKAKRAGSANITVTSFNKKKATVRVRVYDIIG